MIDTALLLGVIAYVLFGVFLVEVAWSQMRTLREADEARDGKYPAYRRTDRPEKWSKWWFYPGAVTLLPIRLLLLVASALLSYVIIKLAVIGIKPGAPLKAWYRRALMTVVYWFLPKAVMLICGISNTRRKVYFDYSEYLGTGYQETQVMPERVSTYVSNHAAWTDIPTMLRHFKIAFVSKAEVEAMPMLGVMTAGIGCIFVTREASDLERNAVVNSIVERQI